MDDIYNRRQKNTNDKFFDRLNVCYHNLKLTIETNPLRFLDTEIIHNNSNNSKKKRLPTPWTSKRYRRNTIKAELYRAKRISSNFTIEVTLLRNKLNTLLFEELKLI